MPTLAAIAHRHATRRGFRRVCRAPTPLAARDCRQRGSAPGAASCPRGYRQA